MLFRERIVGYSENNTNPINSKFYGHNGELVNVKEADTHNYHTTLKV
jgi:hypothetical protein